MRISPRETRSKPAAELEKYSKVGGRDPELLMKLSAIQAEQGRKRGARRRSSG